MDDETTLRGDEEGASHNLRSVCSNKCRSFLTILDIVITIAESVGDQEQAGRPHLHPGGLPEGAGGGCEKMWEKEQAHPFTKVPSVIQVLQGYIMISGGHVEKT
jgi:hypothetical protein